MVLILDGTSEHVAHVENISSVRKKIKFVSATNLNR